MIIYYETTVAAKTIAQTILKALSNTGSRAIITRVFNMYLPLRIPFDRKLEIKR